ncbi:unnamed protein product [Clavelina lepadiformis]|uniref:Uncharacterized protein n=1 Tax=Clavelina lepadiformis TaxID=159417 RepID=A0ABP0GBC0_CLALP
MARKEFDKEGCSLLPMDCYYSYGTITLTVFSAWALQCLHWFDANNGWEDSLCKKNFERGPSMLASNFLIFPNKLDYNEAQEDTVYGRIMCKCEHFPNRRIV